MPVRYRAVSGKSRRIAAAGRRGRAAARAKPRSVRARRVCTCRSGAVPLCRTERSNSPATPSVRRRCSSISAASSRMTASPESVAATVSPSTGSASSMRSITKRSIVVATGRLGIRNCSDHGTGSVAGGMSGARYTSSFAAVSSRICSRPLNSLPSATSRCTSSSASQTPPASATVIRFALTSNGIVPSSPFNLDLVARRADHPRDHAADHVEADRVRNSAQARPPRARPPARKRRPSQRCRAAQTTRLGTNIRTPGRG